MGDQLRNVESAPKPQQLELPFPDFDDPSNSLGGERRFVPPEDAISVAGEVLDRMTSTQPRGVDEMTTLIIPTGIPTEVYLTSAYWGYFKGMPLCTFFAPILACYCIAYERDPKTVLSTGISRMDAMDMLILAINQGGLSAEQVFAVIKGRWDADKGIMRTRDFDYQLIPLDLQGSEEEQTETMAAAIQLLVRPGVSALTIGVYAAGYSQLIGRTVKTDPSTGHRVVITGYKEEAGIKYAIVTDPYEKVPDTGKPIEHIIPVSDFTKVFLRGSPLILVKREADAIDAS